jgi:hypothetical protein
MPEIHNWLTVLLALSLTSAALGQQSATDRSIALSQARAASTNAAADYDKLGAAYIQKGRETSDFGITIWRKKRSRNLWSLLLPWTCFPPHP